MHTKLVLHFLLLGSGEGLSTFKHFICHHLDAEATLLLFWGKDMLNLTNGDNTVSLLTTAQIPGETFAWRDVLHDGPVPGGLDSASLAKVRADFIASQGWGDIHHVTQDFLNRDEKLFDLSQEEELVLWFEHDLYDQLQILQVLDRLTRLPTHKRPSRWSMICIDNFPGISHFRGLGQLKPMDFIGLFPKRQPISDEQLALGNIGWEAFTAPSPNSLNRLLRQDLAALPFLEDAIRRHLQQFPSTVNGLSLTEQITLEGLATGVNQSGALFRYQNVREMHPFLGDWSYWQVLLKLSRGPKPAIKLTTDQCHPPAWHQQAELTSFGEALLKGKADFVQANGIDQWFGGVHLKGHQIPWRWESLSQNAVAYSS